MGSQIGYIDGVQSPLNYPSILTETHVVKGTHPAYNGYLPYALPASATVYMSFYIATYAVEIVPYDKLRQSDKDRIRKVSVGGLRLIEAPSWMSDQPSHPVKIPALEGRVI